MTCRKLDFQTKMSYVLLSFSLSVMKGKIKKENKELFLLRNWFCFPLSILFRLFFPFLFCIRWVLWLRKKFSLIFSYLTASYFLVLSFLHFNWTSLCKCHVHGPLYRAASIYRSLLIWASVHVILWVGFTTVISQWALDFLCNFLNFCMVYLKFHSNKFSIWLSSIL